MKWAEVIKQPESRLCACGEKPLHHNHYREDGCRQPRAHHEYEPAPAGAEGK